MLVPAFVIVLIYKYLPMYGIVIAFQDFMPAKGLFGKQEWVGLRNFAFFFNMPNAGTVIANTVTLSLWKIAADLTVPLLAALLLNELSAQWLKRTIQTMIYLPHFLSWVILSGILVNILSPSNGMVNRALGFFGVEPIFFLGDNRWFPFTLIVTNEWKEFGWGTIIYLATITGIDPSLYEAAEIDGASRVRKVWHVTLPGMRHIIVLLMLLALGRVLNAGFDQIFNLYSPVVYKSGDIIDTMVYRLGILQAQYGVSTAVGLFKSAVSFVLISTSYYLSYRLFDYRVF